jgi:hypothetical protein
MQVLSKDSGNEPPEVKRRASNRCAILYILWLILVILWLPSKWAGGAAEPTDPDNANVESLQVQELSGELEDLIGQLRQERSDYYLQKAETDAEIERMQGNSNVLQSSLDDLLEQETDLDKQIQQYRSEVNGLEKQLGAKSEIAEAIRGQIRSFCSMQKTAIENCTPYKQQERIDRLQITFEDSNDTNSVSVVDQLSRVWSYVQDELRLARSSETYSGRMRMDDGTSPHVRYFRVGQLVLGYITEDGKRAGMWSALSGKKGWRHISDPKQVSDVRDAVDILDRRKAPRLVALPVAIEPAEAARRDP